MKKPVNLVVATLMVLGSLSAFAGVETATDDNDVILAGYDAVAYFTEGRPTKGSRDFTAQHEGAIYHFSSASHRDMFRANPQKYAPAYGGYCAFGTKLGKKFQVDGKAFEVVEGRLYVNKNISVYETWRKDIPGNIVSAEGKWPEIQSVDPDKL